MKPRTDRTSFVSSRLAEIPLVREIQGVCSAAGYRTLYDWTEHGNVRGDPAALAKASLCESWAASQCTVLVSLLANGDKSRQGGLHVELGAFLGTAWVPNTQSALIGHPEPDMSRRCILWVPMEHASVVDPRGDRTLAFYMDPRVHTVVCPREVLPDVVRGTLKYMRTEHR